MDESKIAWADQQKTNEAESDTGQAEFTLPVLDASHFTKLPLASKIFISPTAHQNHNKMFRYVICTEK